MREGGLSNKQFIALALIIVLCGIAIISYDYVMKEKNETYENMSLLLSEEPSIVYKTSDGQSTTIRTSGDTSGKVKQKKGVTYKYVGRIKIPKINLNKGFLKRGQSGNNVDQNVTVLKGSRFPDKKNSNLILASHSGSGWNAYFNNIDRLKKGSIAYIEYGGKTYEYQMIKKYKDKKRDGKVTIYNYGEGKYLTLITCKKPDYRTYYLVEVFRLTKEIEENK